ncbi:hypothetical protein OG985_48910 (plasmid) [Streptomyces sp. NBC_00289]|uniref:hypothetical protein n=1 Tax=Streptomyces sp. NBC_00289 TaxID=2975703 RepID=UPI00324B1C84
MTHELTPLPLPVAAPRADLSLAQDCSNCYQWGTVVTAAGHHTLCLVCQRPTAGTCRPVPAR